MRVVGVFIMSAFVLACSASQPKSETLLEQPRSALGPIEPQLGKSLLAPVAPESELLLYESWPSETTLDNGHIGDVVEQWLAGIAAAERQIDLSFFYAITASGTALERVLAALEAATARGVRLRLILDSKMQKGENAELSQRLASWPRTELRLIDYSRLAGGVQHAKYFIVDGKEAYLGSQNLDWRSLEQIVELGVRVRLPALVKALAEVFELDWRLALEPELGIEARSACLKAEELSYRGEAHRVRAALSPKGYLPCEDAWDLPQMLAMIEGARQRIDIQLLNYSTQNYDKSVFLDLDEALQAAAARGVRVRLLVSSWSKRPKYIRDLQRLEGIENIHCKMVEIPEHSLGYVPYSRTIHSKFMLVDGAMSWLGTSNWSGDYFYSSRNVGLIVEGAAFNRDLSLSFEALWESAYAEAVDPQRQYEQVKHD